MTTNEREFISAKDLPLSEADSVDVLCVDNGELKRKSGANLSGEKTDLVLNITSPLIFSSLSAENTSVTIESGSLEVVAMTLRSGRPPVVKAKHFYLTNEDIPIIEGGVYDCSVLYYNTNISFVFVEPNTGEVKVVMDIVEADYLEVWIYPFARTTVQII